MADSTPSASQFDALLDRIGKVVGGKGLVTDPAAIEPHILERRGRFRGATPFVVKPATTEEVAETVRLCAKAGVAVVPQGGNTSLSAGAIPFEGDNAIIVNLSRLNKIRNLDPDNHTITAEAGCILQQIQESADAADRLFPLSLGAEGSCQIGGNISTNAGGIHVLRYGNMRDLVLGVEVVLPDGRIWDGLRALRKDNTGYDLKHLFIGGEGTLGIVTAAVLKLFAKPRERVTAFVAVPALDAAIELLNRCRAASGEAVTAFEVMPRIGLEFALKHGAKVTDPLSAPSDWYLLIELSAGIEDSGLMAILETVLAEAYDDGIVTDATIATSEAQTENFWRLRECLVDGQKPEGGSIKNDIAVPVSAVPEFIRQASALVESLIPGIRPVPFGHLGDGNIHFNLSQPLGADCDVYLARWDEVNRAVNELVVKFGGSISAEHGLGRMKVAENIHFKTAVEIDLMRKVKAALDPNNIMNPGKVVPL